jgi:cytochrome c-type biogenesis protein CcmH/NrfF
LPQRRPSQFSPKLLLAFVGSLTLLFGQDPTAYMNANVERVGEKLACRCGGCRNTVGNCPMVRCESADPLRHRIAKMQSEGSSDDSIVKAIVKEQGIVALASPPATGFGLFTWIMPAVALLLGFWVYSVYIRRNRKAPDTLTAHDRATLDRFRTQIDSELEDAPPSDARGR